MKPELSRAFTRTGLSRRDFLGTAATLGLAGSTSAAAANDGQNIKRDLSATVQMQFLRPGQLEKALRAFPAVYVPFGLIEWHGRHLPLGNDALKAHGILVKTAEQFGGVVYPPVYFHDGFPQGVSRAGPDLAVRAAQEDRRPRHPRRLRPQRPGPDRHDRQGPGPGRGGRDGRRHGTVGDHAQPRPRIRHRPRGQVGDLEHDVLLSRPRGPVRRWATARWPRT